MAPYHSIDVAPSGGTSRAATAVSWTFWARAAIYLAFTAIDPAGAHVSLTCVWHKNPNYVRHHWGWQ